MNSFDKRFKRRQEQFDKDFQRIRKFSIIWFAFCFTLGMTLLSLVGWVVYKVLLHFAII